MGSKNEILLDQLIELALKLGIKVREEKISSEESPSSGGLCRLKGEYVLILNSQTALEEKIRVIAEAVKTFPLRDIYIRPAVRQWLERSE
ncbi:MAG: hypothetical protein AB1585_13995 [Thermodesulfobacteriota bacterium]